MWFPLGRRGEFGADITVFRRSPGWAIWLLLADLNVDDNMLSGGEDLVRSKQYFSVPDLVQYVLIRGSPVLLKLQGPRTESHSLHMQ